jgi:hypothetical protein
MKTRISAYDPETRTVSVHFRKGSIVHRRSVNACLDEGGVYDRKATKALRGVSLNRR